MATGMQVVSLSSPVSAARLWEWFGESGGEECQPLAAEVGTDLTRLCSSRRHPWSGPFSATG